MQIAKIAFFYFIIIWEARIGMIIHHEHKYSTLEYQQKYLIEHIEYPRFFTLKISQFYLEMPFYKSSHAVVKYW